MEVQANRREALGGGLNGLRRQGWVPGNVYGKGRDSVPVAVRAADLPRLRQAAARKDLLTLRVTGGAGAVQASAAETVLVREVATHPVTDQVQHVSFLRVAVDDQVEAPVAVHLVGEAEAERLHHGRLVPGQNVVHLRGTPANLPQTLEVDVSVLAEGGQVLRLKDVPLPAGLVFVGDPDTVMASIATAAGGGAEAEAAGAAES